MESKFIWYINYNWILSDDHRSFVTRVVSCCSSFESCWCPVSWCKVCGVKCSSQLSWTSVVMLDSVLVQKRIFGPRLQPAVYFLLSIANCQRIATSIVFLIHHMILFWFTRMNFILMRYPRLIIANLCIECGNWYLLIQCASFDSKKVTFQSHSRKIDHSLKIIWKIRKPNVASLGTSLSFPDAAEA